ncbi:MAG: hypothetical protein LH645_00915 [Actinomycetia bacterium]|nr:hypothetical protein [Actinomycetes bacterium]
MQATRRRAAYEERREAARGRLAVREVEKVTTVDRDLSECSKRASLSPAACRRAISASRRVWNGPVAMMTCRAVKTPVDVSATNESLAVWSRLTRVLCQTGNAKVAAQLQR